MVLVHGEDGYDEEWINMFKDKVVQGLLLVDRILKEVKNVNRVCYDMSPKPNATIEWE